MTSYDMLVVYKEEQCTIGQCSAIKALVPPREEKNS